MDRRDMAWDPFQDFDRKTMTGYLFGDRDDLGAVPVKCHMEVCDVCDGRGSHVNPNIDRHGISASEFADDPDFEEDYWSGVYDVSCYQCQGENVVPRPNDDDPNKDQYDETVQDHYEYLAEMEAERRVGA